MYAAKKIESLILEEIKTFSGNSKSTALTQIKTDCKVLIDNLKDDVGTLFSQQSPEKFNRIGEAFLNDAKAMITKYEPQIKSDKSWAPFLKNLALLLSVLGTIPAVYSMGKKAVTGHYSFFDKKTISEEKLKEQLPSEVFGSSIVK